jgi:hypothetical protein
MATPSSLLISMPGGGKTSSGGGGGACTQSTPTTTNNNNNPPNPNKSRFPRLQECAHFHYEVSTVELPKDFKIVMCQESSQEANLHSDTNNANNKPNVSVSSTSTNNNNNSASSPNQTNSSQTPTISTNSSSSSSAAESHLFHLQVTANEKRWIIYRSYENFRYLDKHLHDCIFDRKFSCLEEPVVLGSSHNGTESTTTTSTSAKKKATVEMIKQLRHTLAVYLTRFSEIAFVNPINCGPILNWFEVGKTKV